MERAVACVGMVVGGRYRLDAEIGHGGMSQVYRATDTRIGTEVAIKLLGRDAVDGDGQQRFRREAELVRKLQHPNTVRLLDFDPVATPLPYIVYELLEGETLDRMLRREGPQSEERVVRITSQVLKSLMEAHAAGIVHRDMKPANIFVCEFAGESDFVKVLDFGIAKAEGPGATALTAAGTVVGTPRYMPPEQVRGAPVSPAMDVYAVGMMMAEMLHGAPVLRGSAIEIVRAQLRDDPITLPERAQSSRLGEAIARATEKDPSRRIGSASELLSTIATALEGRALQPRSALTQEQTLPLSSGDAPTLMMPEAQTTARPDSGNAATRVAPLAMPALVAPRAVAAASRRKFPFVAAVLGAGSAALVFVIAFGALRLLRPDRTPSDPIAVEGESPAPASPPVAPLTTTSSAVDGEPVRLSITTTPPGATILRDGTEVCAEAPCVIEVARNVALELEARRGDLRGTAKVLAQQSQSVAIVLARP